MCFADCLIIDCVTLAGHNTDPVLYASGLLFKRPMKSDDTDHSSFLFSSLLFLTTISVHSAGQAYLNLS